MSFLKLFTGVKMPSLEFERLKNKVAVAAATIAHQNAVIADLEAKLAASAPAPTPVPDVTDADYVALGKVLDDVFAVTPALAPVANEIAPAEPTILPQADLAHPALSGA